MPPLPPSFKSWLDYYRYVIARLPADVDPSDREKQSFNVVHYYFDYQQGCEVKHELLLWQLKWLCFDELFPLLPSSDEAWDEYRAITYAAADNYIPPNREPRRLVTLLEFIYSKTEKA